MRKQLIIGALLAVAAVPSMGGATPETYYTVPPDSQALVLQGGQIVRKTDAGIHPYDPQTEQVVIEPVFKETRFSFDAPFDIQGCAADMVLSYRIGDLEAYYLGGRDLSALGTLRSDIVTALQGLPDRAITLDNGQTYVQGVGRQLSTLRKEIAGGLLVTRVEVSLADGCVPQRVVREVQVGGLATPVVGALAAERAASVGLRVTTSDGAKLQIDGIVPTFQVVDPSAVATCFGQSPNAAAIWAGNLTTGIVSDVVETLTLDQLDTLATQLPAALQAAGFAQCGLKAGGVDFRETTILQRTIVNCDAVAAEICRPN